MSAADIVNVNITATGAAPTLPGFGVPVILAYHTHYPDTIRYYAAAGGLAAMVADGWNVNEAGYKAAAALLAQSPNVTKFGIAKRRSPPQQTIQLVCTDALVGDKYSLTVVTVDGVSHPLSMTVAANAGAAVTGTVAVTNNSASITFSGSQTMSAGDILVFSSQPTAYYALSAGISGATAGTLTGAYNGTTNAAATATRLATLSGTFGATNGSATVTTTVSQVGTVSAGDSIMFTSQLGTIYQVSAVTASNITLTTPYNGTTAGATHASDIATLAGVGTQLVTLLQTVSALGAGGAVSSVTNGAAMVRSDGQLVDVQNWSSNFQLSDLTTDPGVAGDLAVVYAYDPVTWYGLILDSNSAAEIKAAAAWTESNKKFFFCNNSDYANTTTATTDVFSALKTGGYARTYCEHNGTQLLSFAGAGQAGVIMPRNPGSYTFAFKTKALVPCDSQATGGSLPEGAQLNLTGKNGNFYVTTQGLNLTQNGLTPSGVFADQTIFSDWFTANLQVDVITLLASNPKIPYTDAGIDQVVSTIKTRIKIGGSAPYGGFDLARGYIVIQPAVSTIPLSSKLARQLTGITFQAYFSGAIQFAQLNGSVSV